MNHVCTAMNLHEQVWAVRGEEVVTSWKVEARGKLQ
jgi:D-serine deaminase-like pyridoxal phosphate-dependent protein